MLRKHKAPEAGRWPAREQLPDVPAIPALVPRRNYLRPKPIMGLTRNAIWISKLAEKILLGPEQDDALGPKTPLKRTRNREPTPRLRSASNALRCRQFRRPPPARLGHARHHLKKEGW